MSPSRRVLLAMRVGLCALPLSWGCASVAKITTLPDAACRQRLTTALVTVLEGQGEAAEIAERLAASTAEALQVVDPGPRPFLVAAPSGVDYSFFVERKGASCLLRLYGRQKGFVSYTNNISYIATEPLAPCECAE